MNREPNNTNRMDHHYKLAYVAVKQFFFHDPESFVVIIPHGKKYIVRFEIVAIQPGDYSDTFYVFPEFDTLESEALGAIIDYEEEINLVIFPGE